MTDAPTPLIDTDAPSLFAAAARAVENRRGYRVTFDGYATVDAAAHVVRSTMDGVPGGPHAVVIKSAQPEQRPRLMNAAAGLLFLRSLAASERPWPDIYGVDVESGIVVVEDVAGEGSPGTLAQAAAALGTIHGLAARREPQFLGVRAMLGPDEPHPNLRMGVWLAQNLPGVVRYLEERGVAVHAGFADDAHTIARELFEPGPLWTLTLFDIRLADIAVGSGIAKLVNYDWAAYRNACVDAACLCYAAASAADLPDTALPNIEAAHRTALTAALPTLAAADYDRGMAAANAFWPLHALCIGVQSGDLPTARTMRLLDAFAQTRGASAYPTLAATFERLGSHLDATIRRP